MLLVSKILDTKAEVTAYQCLHGANSRIQSSTVDKDHSLLAWQVENCSANPFEGYPHPSDGHLRRMVIIINESSFLQRNEGRTNIEFCLDSSWRDCLY